MKPSPKDTKLNDSEDSSLNFDDNYNEEEFLKQNNKIQKLSIMNDFNQLCHKFNQQPTVQKTSELPQQNTLAQYYAKLKLKNQENQDKNKNSIKEESQKQQTNDGFGQKNNKPSPLQPHHIKSSSSNIANIQQQNNPLQIPKNERNPSQGQAFKKKIVQEMQINDSKRNYSSVQDKKKILQPSKNTLNTYQNLSMKDYYGDEKNVNIKKQTIKNMVIKDHKTPKDTMINSQNSQNKQTKNQRTNKENSLKESNMINKSKNIDTLETQKTSKVTEKDFDKDYCPKIVLLKKRIDLSLDPELVKAMLREEQMRSDYDMSNVSMSSIDEGLFGNAIEKQRSAKTSQTVQSPHPHHIFMPPTGKEHMNIYQKQYISSPINITHSPNPTNMQKSIFQKRELNR